MHHGRLQYPTRGTTIIIFLCCNREERIELPFHKRPFYGRSISNCQWQKHGVRKECQPNELLCPGYRELREEMEELYAGTEDKEESLQVSKYKV